MEGDGSDNERGDNDFFNPEEEIGITGTAKVSTLNLIIYSLKNIKLALLLLFF
jgi:hypothetical protein